MKTKDERLHNHFFGRCKKTYLKSKEITSIRMNVVFPVPFSPSNTIIWESLKLPFMTDSLKPDLVFTIVGYL